MLLYDYTPLKEILKRKKISAKQFIKDNNINTNELFALEVGGVLPAQTLSRICLYLCCDVNDICTSANGDPVIANQ